MPHRGMKDETGGKHAHRRSVLQLMGSVSVIAGAASACPALGATNSASRWSSSPRQRLFDACHDGGVGRQGTGNVT